MYETNIRHGTAGLAALLMLAALFCAGMQAAMAGNEMAIGIGDYLGNGTRLPNLRTVIANSIPHWEPLITLDNR